MKLLAAVLLMAVTASAQSAKVVRLSPGDAAQAKQLDADQKALSERASKFHDHIVRSYLVTTSEKEANGCCDNIWHDPEDQQGGTLTGWSSTTSQGFLLRVGSGGDPEHCETPIEKANRQAIEKKAKEEQDAYEKAHPTKYYRDVAWRDGFQFSDSFEYIVPAERNMPIANSNPCGITLTGDSH